MSRSKNKILENNKILQMMPYIAAERNSYSQLKEAE